MKIDISLRLAISKATKPAGIPLPAGNFARVLHDDEATDGRQRIGMPETQPLYYVDFSPMTEQWQWFWFRQMIYLFTNFVHWDEKRLPKAELDRLKAEWRSLTHGKKAFNNNHGTNEAQADGSDGGIDYISGRHNAGRQAKQASLITCGNVVRVLGSRTAKGVPIETLDGLKPPPPIEKVNRLTTPWLIFAATNVPADKSDPKNWKPIYTASGRIRVDPFPNLAPKDTPVPLLSNSNKTGGRYTRDGISLVVNWIKSDRLTPITDGFLPSPYVR